VVGLPFLFLFIFYFKFGQSNHTFMAKPKDKAKQIKRLRAQLSKVVQQPVSKLNYLGKRIPTLRGRILNKLKLLGDV